MKEIAPMRVVVAVALSLFALTAGADPLKNLQVLPKDSTKDQVKQIMRAQAKALDVECDYCHDVPDMASDANPNKKIAREMMKMTIEINGRLKGMKDLKDVEKHTVTCNTCHRGAAEPKP
jgi:hypothetical protein